ncbi:MAG: hypothetical protein IJM30_01610 [Thermoguttaceae bacterium]|nr:hypothetical protein [Thermoguttaceae bacterium]
MRSFLVVSLIAALGFVVSNVQAQDAAVSASVSTQGATAAIAPAVDASQTVVRPTGECDECADVGYGGIGIGRPGFGFGFGGRIAGWQADRREEVGRIRQIVQASPFANPSGEAQDWVRFRNYPYGYYEHNFAPADMRIPGYNPAWQNYYPAARRYHTGHHFNLDVF